MNTYTCDPAFVLTNEDSLIVDNSVPGCTLACIDDCINTPWVQTHLNQAFDKHGYRSNPKSRGGYALKIEDSYQSEYPLRTCFYITQNHVSQKPHNLIVVGDNVRVKLLSTCKSYSKGVSSHLGDTELFIGNNSHVELFMIHSWNHKTRVAPRTVVIMGSGSTFMDTYALIQSPKYYSFHPYIYCSDNCTVCAQSNCEFNQTESGEIGFSIYLEGNANSADITGTTAATQSKLTNPFSITAHGSDNKGHVVCDGILLDSRSAIHATPELCNANYSSNLSHEASIGSLNSDQLMYLRSRGFSESEATQMIIHSKLRHDRDWVPQHVIKEAQALY
jgi:hypothetical protein